MRAARKFSRHAKIETLGVYDDNREDIGGELAALISESILQTISEQPLFWIECPQIGSRQAKRRGNTMKTLLNVLWVALVGFWTALGWLFWAALLALTIVGLPFARQCLKFARFTLWPFGREAISSPTASRLGAIGNLLWLIPGVIMAIGYAIGGVLLLITIIGIPFGIQAFKFAGMSLAPFGKEIVRTKDLRSGAWAQQQVGAMATGTAPPPDQPAPPHH